MNQEFDVIVVGAGGGGLAAAYSAAEHGAQVLILEKQSQPGGTTGIAVGSFTAAATSFQRAANIDDNSEDHAEDLSKFANPEIEAHNNDSLRRFFLQHTAETLQWLQKLGLAFVGPSPEPPNRQPRMHNVVPGAKAYIAAFQVALRKKGATLLCDAEARSLLKKDDRVTGVRAIVNGQELEFRASRGVILAAGDYANNPEIIAKHKGHQYQKIEGINPFAKGDGHQLAQAAGAKLVNMEVTYGPELRFVPSSKNPFQQWLPASGPAAKVMGFIAPRLPKWIMGKLIKRLLVMWQHPENSLFDDGAVLLNQHGRRFINEKSFPDREIALANQPGKIAYILLDSQLVERYSAWPNFISTAPDIAYAYVKDYQRLRPDVTVTGVSLNDVSARRGLNLEQMAKTVDEFNRYVEGKQNDPFGRKGDTQPLAKGPWVLLGPVKVYFTTTEGGATVNQKLQVLDEQEQVIPGLYAAGQNGLSGMILWSHGLHIAWAMTSGRLAGKSVMVKD